MGEMTSNLNTGFILNKYTNYSFYIVTGAVNEMLHCSHHPMTITNGYCWPLFYFNILFLLSSFKILFYILILIGYLTADLQEWVLIRLSLEVISLENFNS